MSLAEEILRTCRFFVECRSKVGRFTKIDKLIFLQPSSEAAKRNLLQVASDEWCLGCPINNTCWSDVDSNSLDKTVLPFFMRVKEIPLGGGEEKGEP